MVLVTMRVSSITSTPQTTKWISDNRQIINKVMNNLKIIKNEKLMTIVKNVSKLINLL